MSTDKQDDKNSLKKSDAKKLIISKPIEEKTLYKVNAKISDNQTKIETKLELNNEIVEKKPKNDIKEAKTKNENENKDKDKTDNKNKDKAIDKVNIDYDLHDKVEKKIVVPTFSKSNSNMKDKYINVIDKNDKRYPMYEKLIAKPCISISNEDMIDIITRYLS